MKNVLIIVLTFFLFISCQNKPNISLPNGEYDQAPLAPCINEAFAYFIKYEEGYDEAIDTSAYYELDFWYMEPEFPINDTIIWMGRRNSRMPTDGFKGYTTIGNYKLLVFDKNNVGHYFYNQDSLKYINLDSLSFTTATSSGPAFVVHDSLLLIYNRQPDGYEPIKIR